MARENEVRLTFSGDSQDAEQATTRVIDRLRAITRASDNVHKRLGALNKITTGLATTGMAGLAGASAASAAAVTAVAGSAIAAGAAMAGMGIAAAAANEKVQEAFARTKDTAVDLVTEASKGYVPVLKKFGDDMTTVLEGDFGQHITRSIENSLPAVRSVTEQIPQLIADMGPMIESFAGAGIGSMNAFAEGLTPVVQSITDALTPLAPLAGHLGVAFTEGLMAYIPELMAALGPLLATLTTLGGTVLGALLPPIGDLVAMLVSGLGPALEVISPAVEAFSTIIGTLVAGLTGGLNGALGEAVLQLPQLSSAATPLMNVLAELATLIISELAPVLGVALGAAIEGLIPLLTGMTAGLIAMMPAITVIVSALGEFLTFLAPLMQLLGPILALYAVWTVAQWALNTAMTANPIGIIIVAIGALVAAIVYIATKTTWFQDAWSWAWDKIQAGISAVWNWIKSNWPLLLGILFGPVGAAIAMILKHKDKLMSAIKALPGQIKSATAGMWDGIKNAFKSAINWIIRKWNNLSFTLPSVDIPGIGKVGGGTLNTPNIPTLHSGGIVPGAPGTEKLALLQAGEQVKPIRASSNSGNTDMITLRIQSAGTPMDKVLAQALVQSLRSNPRARNDIRAVLA